MNFPYHSVVEHSLTSRHYKGKLVIIVQQHTTSMSTFNTLTLMFMIVTFQQIYKLLHYSITLFTSQVLVSKPKVGDCITRVVC